MIDGLRGGTMLGWFRDLTAKEREAMLACFGGWSLDALDVQVYSFVMPTIIGLWAMSNGQAGLIGTVTLLISSFGGWIAGTLCDRYGRVRMLQITILWYAFFTFLCGFAQDFTQLFVLRALHGFGFGGEWAAGAVLMGEAIRDKYRGRAVGLVQTGWAFGWGAAAVLYTGLFAVLPEAMAWRVLFWIGIIPAFFVFWVRRHINEPEVYHRSREGAARIGPGHLVAIFRRPYLSTTILVSLMVTGAQGGGYALAVWLPTYLKNVRGLSAPSTGGFLIVVIVSAFLGFLLGSYLSDAIGRKWTFLVSAIGSLVMILIAMFTPLSVFGLLLINIPLGIVLYIKFPPMGPFMTELYPTAIRGTGQGFCYNAGRGFGAVFPALIGFLSERMSLAAAIGVFSAIAFGLMIVALLMLPETRGRSLDLEIAGGPQPALRPARSEIG
ncbi:MAG: MFS transporter [Alphaproteobacteria bacterium]|nr:MFS transporter [Alphaproteobacteria bacterium]